MLLECHECGKSISDKASKCQHCGAPLTRAGNQVLFGVLLATGGVILALASWPDPIIPTVGGAVAFVGLIMLLAGMTAKR